ncbi:MAG TPA: hypothetical protein PK454_10845 [Anaerolineaceae bacterium]|nr:hypothetical protein [Anaerolineaceae bacterium]HOG80240.1 hypothetical protein [Anaerolineaceae bacterium]
MRKRRITWFLVSIGLGIALGLLYGWVLRPVPYQDVPMDTLRQDFRTDYILMVAQAYTLDHDAALALRRLSSVDTAPGVRLVQETIIAAQQMGYARPDIETLAALAQGLQEYVPPLRGQP